MTRAPPPEGGVAPAPSESAQAIACLHGPFRLVLKNGRDITPGGKVRQALLCVLLLSPGQTRARSSLQAMFWSESEPRKAALSLRNMLLTLRKDLEPLGGEVLRADRHSVSLVPGRILIDPAVPPTAEFLEGMDLEGCEPFEEWLSEHRGVAAGIAVQSVARQRQPSEGAGIRTALGLLPTLQADLKTADLLRVESIGDTIVRFIAQNTSLDVHDLRDHGSAAVPLPIASGLGPTHLLQAVAERRDARLVFRLRLRLASARQLLWASEPVDILAEGAAGRATALAETLLQKMAGSPAAADAPDLYPWTALTALFSLDSETIFRTDTQIQRMAAGGNRPVLDCLHAFAQVFKANEGVAPPERFSPDYLQEALAAVPQADPMRPLCESLIGYSAHMLLGDNALAETLLTSAHERAPNLALNLDHLAVVKLMRGDLASAEAFFQRCHVSGAASPWRYTYDVTGAMIAMARGDYPRALAFANRALLRKPRFIGALRYAMVGFALTDNPGDARRLQKRIRTLRPDYDFPGWADSMTRRTHPRLAATLADSLIRHGLV